MADSKKRIALKPHMEQIREWVEAGKADEWIADALGTSASSVQSFRSRNDIYRRERGLREPESVFEGVLDHGERDGWGLWLDPAVAADRKSTRLNSSHANISYAAFCLKKKT